MRHYIFSALLIAASTALCEAAPADLTVQEINRLKDQIQQCWSAVHPELKPTIQVNLNRDGTVADAAVSADQAQQYAQEGDFKEAADAALKAVNSCGPYKLPPEKYETWQTIVMEFEVDAETMEKVKVPPLTIEKLMPLKERETGPQPEPHPEESVKK